MSRPLCCAGHAPVRMVQAVCTAIILMAGACSEPTSPVLPPQQVLAAGTASLLTVAPTGVETALGTERSPLSLEKAVTSAPAGATVQLLSGTYHTGNLVVTRPMIFRPAPGATVTFSGSAEIPSAHWQSSGRGWRTPWSEPSTNGDEAALTVDRRLATATASGSAAPSIARRGAFLDGRALAPASRLSELAPGKFYIDPIGKWLYIGDSPNGHIVEAAAHQYGMVVAAAGSRISGVTFQNFSQIGLRVSSSNVRIDHNTFSNNGMIGLDINGVSNVLVEYNTITYNGQVGIEASHVSNVTVQNNNISHNNTRNYDVSGAAAGIKITSSDRFTVRNNWVADNAANAVWIDAGTTNTTISGNQVLRNKCYGIYFELSNTALIVGNIAHDNGQAGIGVHFTANARIYNNTLVNNGMDLDVSASYNRAPYDLSHATIVNNLMWNSKWKVMMNLYRWNGCNSWVYSQVDYNGYYRPSGSPAWAEVNWCNNWYTSLWSFQHGAGYEWHALQIDGGSDPFFVNVWNGDYRLHNGSPAIRRGQALPWDVAAALGVRSGVPVNLGAMQ